MLEEEERGTVITFRVRCLNTKPPGKIALSGRFSSDGFEDYFPKALLCAAAVSILNEGPIVEVTVIFFR